MTPALIERLKELHARSTPGPWVVKGDCGVHGPNDEHGNPTMVIYDEGGHNRDDALCIAALHNAFPQIMAELSRLCQSEAELRRDAEKYRYMRDNAPKEGVTVKFRPEGDSITWGVVPEADAIDAERYRWLKGQVHMGVVADNGQRFNAKLLDGHRDGNRILCSFILRHGAASAFATPKYRDLDAAIDAALGETK